MPCSYGSNTTDTNLILDMDNMVREIIDERQSGSGGGGMGNEEENQGEGQSVSGVGSLES